MVDILIGQIDTTCIGNLPINNHDFTVVTVVISNGQTWNHLVKFVGFNPSTTKLDGVISRQGCHTTNIIIEKLHFYTLSGLFFQNLQNTIPHQTFFDDIVFEKDKLLSFLEIL